MAVLSSARRQLALILFIGIVARGLFLEYADLIDPTEARYAAVAQEMVLSGDWLTPQLPFPGGVVPYLGKPPLHFWLTAISYELFGVDEWTSRLVSLLATLGLLFLIYWFTKLLCSATEALLASAIFLSTSEVYFLAGASVTDMTLTLMISCSVALLHSYLREETPRNWKAFASAAFAALAFLTKGPIGVALVFFPFLLWSLTGRNFSWVRRVPWLGGIAVALILIVPWFMLNEAANPGFIKYFVWNENIGRYLFKNYGDRYGSGHVHMYGAIWVMLLLAFMPWTFSFIGLSKTKNRKNFFSLLKSNTDVMFITCWAAATPIFFTFVRQLHGMYALPALPPLAILSAILLSRVLGAAESRIANLSASPLLAISAIAAIALASVGVFLKYSSAAVVLTAVIAVLTCSILYRMKNLTGLPGFAAKSSVPLFSLYLLGIANLSPYIDAHRSSVTALRTVMETRPCRSTDHAPRVGISTRNSFSHYWAANNWKNELPREVKIVYVEPEDAAAADICAYLSKSRSLDQVPNR